MWRLFFALCMILATFGAHAGPPRFPPLTIAFVTQPAAGANYSRTSETGGLGLGAAPVSITVNLSQNAARIEWRLRRAADNNSALTAYTSLDTAVAAGNHTYLISVPATVPLVLLDIRVNGNDLDTITTGAFSVGKPIWTNAQFLNSMGINFHVGNSSDNCGTNCTYSTIASMLSYLSINQVRANDDTGRQNAYLAYSNSYGVKWLLIHNCCVTGLSDELALGASNLIGVSGPNEVDCNWAIPSAYSSAGYTTNVTASTQLMKDTFAAVKAQPSLASVPVIGLSYTVAPCQARDGDISPYMDVADNHAYCNNGNPPSCGVQFIAGQAGTMAHNRVYWVTENGYSTDVSTADTSRVTEHVQALYTLYFYLDCHARYGAQKCFPYELYDSTDNTAETPSSAANIEAWYGLFRYQANPAAAISPKLAATAVQTLRAILADAGTPASSPLNIPVTFGGAVSGETFDDFAASDGTHWLVYWGENGVWTGPTTYTENAAPTTMKTATFASSKTVDFYDPMTGSGITSTATGSTVSFTPGWDPIILHVH